MSGRMDTGSLGDRDLRIRKMQESDILRIVPLYMEYYNTYEEGEWTRETTFKRIHQVYSREDSLCMILEEQDGILAFALGYLEQYDDGMVYDLVEILVSRESQSQGLGSWFLEQIEVYVKEEGAILIQLQSVNDAMHEHFYGKLGFCTARNLVLKSKVL